MFFGGKTHVDPRNVVLDEGGGIPTGSSIWGGGIASRQVPSHYSDLLVLSTHTTSGYVQVEILHIVCVAQN